MARRSKKAGWRVGDSTLGKATRLENRQNVYAAEKLENSNGAYTMPGSQNSNK